MVGTSSEVEPDLIGKVMQSAIMLFENVLLLVHQACSSDDESALSAVVCLQTGLFDSGSG